MGQPLSGRERLTAVVLIVANAVPLSGVLLFGWKVFPLILLYWLENVIVGAFNAAISPVTGKNYSDAEVISRFGIPDSQMIRRELSSHPKGVADRAVVRGVVERLEVRVDADKEIPDKRVCGQDGRYLCLGAQFHERPPFSTISPKCSAGSGSP